MNSTPGSDGRPSALIVAIEGSDRVLLAEALGARGVVVRNAEDFLAATQALATGVPDVLVTELRLGPYNGLHLILRGRAAHPRMKALVLTRTVDSVLRREAAQVDAELLVRTDDGAWLASIVSAVGPLAGRDERHRLRE